MHGIAKIGTRSNDATPSILSQKWPVHSEPTKGLEAHQNKGAEMFKTFLDNHVENIPYNAYLKTQIEAQGKI
jgi:hypothetical protein